MRWDYQGRTTKNIKLFSKLNAGLRKIRNLPQRRQENDLKLNTGELKIERQVCQIKGELLIQPPKNKASIRTVILPPAVVAALRAYKQTVSSRWMFPSPKKEDAPIAPSVTSHRLAKILKHAGCKKVRFHDLRHSYAVAAIKSGDDIKTVQENLGHATAAFTLDVYGHVTAQMRRESASSMEQFIQSVSAG